MQSSIANARRCAIRISWSTSLVLLILCAALCSSALARKAARPNGPQRIRLTTGAISARVNGRFTRSDQRVRYVIKAKKGDHIVVNIIPITRGLTMGGAVAWPSGKGDGGPGGIVVNVDLNEDGDYQIEVFQHTMGSNYASGNFILEVVIAPAG